MSRWEIENQGLNEGNNLCRMEHIQHHHPNSMLENWLFPLLASMIERLYPNRYLHRNSTHLILTAIRLKDTLWLNLRPAADKHQLMPGCGTRKGAALIKTALGNDVATVVSAFRHSAASPLPVGSLSGVRRCLGRLSETAASAKKY
jgi:hypothetical protein